MKIHNAFIQESVDLANQLDFKPLFTVVIGDVCDKWGYEKDLQLGMNNMADTWHESLLIIREDHDAHSEGSSFGELDIDRLFINLGVWDLNDGDEQPFGIYFKDFKLDYDQPGSSQAGGMRIVLKSREDEWWRNKIWSWKNIAGEHRYIIATQK